MYRVSQGIYNSMDICIPPATVDTNVLILGIFYIPIFAPVLDDGL